MPSLAERIAEFMGGEYLNGTEHVPPAVKLGKKHISLPHLSYGYWPPHKAVGNINFEFRLLYKLEIRSASDSTESTYKVASWLWLTTPFLPKSNLQKKIRASLKQGFVLDNGGAELIDDFWLCYSKHIHRLGSLPLPKRFFNAILAGFDEGYAEIFVLRHNSEVVGSACNVFIDGFYENVWFATSHESQKMGSSYFLHFHMIQQAYQLGADVYSFGRSTNDSGVHQFKRQWGTQDVPLIWLKHGRQIQGRYRLQMFSIVLKQLSYRIVVYLGDKLARYIY